tara:strand:- start:388 stop:573 length:186 start_codon:yes stop_codon:yes gene_type:complete
MAISLKDYKNKPWAWQSGWLCARDGRPHDLIYGPESTIEEYNKGYAAYHLFSQVHSPSTKV